MRKFQFINSYLLYRIQLEINKKVIEIGRLECFLKLLDNLPEIGDPFVKEQIKDIKGCINGFKTDFNYLFLKIKKDEKQEINLYKEVKDKLYPLLTEFVKDLENRVEFYKVFSEEETKIKTQIKDKVITRRKKIVSYLEYLLIVIPTKKDGIFKNKKDTKDKELKNLYTILNEIHIGFNQVCYAILDSRKNGEIQETSEFEKKLLSEDLMNLEIKSLEEYLISLWKKFREICYFSIFEDDEGIWEDTKKMFEDLSSLCNEIYSDDDTEKILKTNYENEYFLTPKEQIEKKLRILKKKRKN